MANLVAQYPQAAEYARQLHLLANGEAVIATLVIAHVSLGFVLNYLFPRRISVIRKNPAK